MVSTVSIRGHAYPRREVCGVIEIHILGQIVTASPSAVAKLRDLAAAEAGRSNSARDLSLVLDRALRTGATVALQRGEARALIQLLDAAHDDPELRALAAAIHPNQPQS